MFDEKKFFDVIQKSIENYFEEKEKEKLNQEINKKEKPNQDISNEINESIIKILQLSFEEYKFSIITNLFYKENPETKFYFTSQTFYREDFETKTYNFRISNVKEENKNNCIYIKNLKYFIFISVTIFNVKTIK